MMFGDQLLVTGRTRRSSSTDRMVSDVLKNDSELFKGVEGWGKWTAKEWDRGRARGESIGSLAV